MADREIDELVRQIGTDPSHTQNSFDLKDPKLAVLLDALLERGLILGENIALDQKLYPDPKTFDVMNRAHLLAYAAKWAADRLRELQGHHDDAAVPNPAILNEGEKPTEAVVKRLRDYHTRHRTWSALEREYRRVLRALVNAPSPSSTDLEFGVWFDLGVVYRDRLGAKESAREAFQMAVRYRPDDDAARAALESVS